VLKFDGAMRQILAQKKARVLSVELLKPISQLLLKCPECSTLWNYRREIFIELKDKADIACDKVQIGQGGNDDVVETNKDGDKEINEKGLKLKSDLLKLCHDELNFIESCLKINPKAYGSWHHRVWLQTFMEKNNLPREIELCNQFLTADERNCKLSFHLIIFILSNIFHLSPVHCWDYRRIIVNLSGLSAYEELKYTTKLIDNNFSNFSAWHYRSSLLSKLYTTAANDDDLQFVQKTLDDDLQKVQEAIFTDPSDQSAWFYLRWLITIHNQGFPIPGKQSTPLEKPLNISQELRETLEELLKLEPNNKWINYIMAWIQSEDKLIGKLIEIDPLRENFYRHLSSPSD